MNQYNIFVNNKNLGPYTKEELLDLVQRGYLPVFSRCQRVGDSDWSTIKEIEELAVELKNSYMTRSELDNWDEDTFLKKLQDWQVDKTRHSTLLQDLFDETKFTPPPFAKTQSKIIDQTVIINPPHLQNKIPDPLEVEAEELLEKTNEWEKTMISPKTEEYLKKEKLKEDEKKKLLKILNTKNDKDSTSDAIFDAEYSGELVDGEGDGYDVDDEKTVMLQNEKSVKNFKPDIKKVNAEWERELKKLHEEQEKVAKIRKEENREIQKYNESIIKKNKKKKSRSLMFIVLALIIILMFLPEENENPKESKKVEIYTLPKIEFPEVYSETDEEHSNELFEQAQLALKNFNYGSLLVAVEKFKEAYQQNEKNKKIMHKIILCYSLMLQHSDDIIRDGIIIFKLFQLLGEGSEFQSLDILTAKAYFYLTLEKYQAVNFLIEKYLSINSKVNTLLYAAYLKSLVASGDLVKAKVLIQRVSGRPEKSPYLYDAILDYLKLENLDKKYWDTFKEGLTEHQDSVLILTKGLHYYSKILDWEKVSDILKRIQSLGYGKSRYYYAEYLHYQGLLLAVNQKPVEASKVLKKSLDLIDNPELRHKLAMLNANAKNEEINLLIKESKSVELIEQSKKYAASFDWDIALTKAIDAVENTPDSYKAVINLGLLQSDLGFYQLAINNLEKIRKRDQINNEININLLRVYSRAYKFSEAHLIVSMMAQTNQMNSDYFSKVLSEYYEKKGDILKSILWLQQAVKLNPLNDSYLYELAKSYIKNNNFKVAKDLIIRAMSLDPSNLDYHMLYSDILYDRDDPNTAVGYLRQILKDFPDNPKILNKIAIFYYRTGQIKNFEELKNKLQNIPQSGAELYLYLMESARKENRYDDFVGYGRDYLKKIPGDLTVRMALVEIYYLQNKFDKAREELLVVEERMETYPKVQYYLAKMLLAEGKKEFALKAANQEAKNHPLLEEAFVLVGDISRLMENYPDAEKAYKSAQRINPKSVDSLKGIALIKMEKGEIDSAIDLFKKALKSKPDDASLYLVLGDLYRKMSVTQEAVKAYKSFLEIEPESPEKGKIELYLKSVKQ